MTYGLEIRCSIQLSYWRTETQRTFLSGFEPMRLRK